MHKEKKSKEFIDHSWQVPSRKELSGNRWAYNDINIFTIWLLIYAFHE